MHKLTIEEFSEADFGDLRRGNRLVSIINNISSQPGSSIPRQSESWYETKATYEFFKNEEVSIDALKKALQGYGVRQVKDEMTLLIAHDISNITFNGPGVEGLGYIDNKAAQGVLCYSSIAISTEGQPLSLLYQHTWTRPHEELGKRALRKSRKFEDKESYRWYEGMQQTNKLLGESVHKIHLADRQADVYELFFHAYRPNTDLIIRAAHDRHLPDGSPIWGLVGKQPAVATIALDIPDASGKKKTPIPVEVRFQPVKIYRPTRSKDQYESVELTAIEIKEAASSNRTSADKLHWKLFTTLEVNTVKDALQCVEWYTFRWRIERFHYVLKSGTKIEELQLKQADSLQKAIMVYSIAAFRIMQLVYASRRHPQVSCEVILTSAQWKVLYVLINKKKEIPKDPPSLYQAVMWIGRLGGHLGRKSDGVPGLKTVWYGYQRLSDAAMFHELMAENLGKA